MIDTVEFHRRLGATQPLGPDEQLLLDPGIRVLCAASGWTAVFESLSADEARMTALFDCCRREPALIPFSTRSEQLALRLQASVDRDDTDWALQRLQDSLRVMVPDRANPWVGAESS
jgi:hypothetical protein